MNNRAIVLWNIRFMLLMTCLAAVGVCLLARLFIIGLPSEKFSGCLSYHLFLVSKSDTKVERGGIYAMTLDRTIGGVVPAGSRFLKIVAAKGGDKVRVTSSGVWVNEERFYPLSLTHLAQKMHLDMNQIQKTITVPAGELFMIGNTEISYDSRFWGTINEKNVLGRAFVLF